MNTYLLGVLFCAILSGLLILYVFKFEKEFEDVTTKDLKEDLTVGGLAFIVAFLLSSWGGVALISLILFVAGGEKLIDWFLGHSIWDRKIFGKNDDN